MGFLLIRKGCLASKIVGTTSHRRTVMMASGAYMFYMGRWKSPSSIHVCYLRALHDVLGKELEDIA